MLTNSTRAQWAAEAIGVFASITNMHGEDEQTKAKDLVTDIVHFLRLTVGMTHEQAASVIQFAVDMAEMEMIEEPDDD